MNHQVRINGETLHLKLKGLRHGDPVHHVHEQCEGCGTAMDAEGEAYLFAKDGRYEIRCGVCATCYPVQSR